MLDTVRIALSGRISEIISGFIFVGMWVSVMIAVRAWRDVVAIDRENATLSTQVLDPILARFVPKTEIAQRQLRLQLQQAGYRSQSAERAFGIFRVSLMGGAAFLVSVLAATAEASTVLVGGGIMLALAFWVPDVWLQNRIRARQERIGRALPAVIDLMVLCLDVGLSIEAAFERVTHEIRPVEPLMADEASQMLGEMGAGLTFPQSLRRMADRVGNDDLSTLSRLISQATGLGASIAQALREYSEASFNRRILGLEEKAGKISSLMVLPVTTCMLPATLIALVGPAIILLIRAFSQL